MIMIYWENKSKEDRLILKKMNFIHGSKKTKEIKLIIRNLRQGGKIPHFLRFHS